MFILKRFKSAEWAIIPDGIVDELWEEIASPYRKYFEDHEKEVAETITANPAIILDNPNSLKGIEYSGMTVYIANTTPDKYRLLGLDEYTKFLDSLKRTFSRIFDDRIQKLFSSRLGNFANFNAIVKTPSSIDRVEQLIRDHDHNQAHCVYTFHQECEKITPAVVKEVRSKILKLGEALDGALYHKDERSYAILMRRLNNIVQSDNTRINKWHYPPTMLLAQNRPNVTSKVFRLCIYQNGTLVYERRGNLLHYAWIDMMYKLMKNIKRYNGGRWIFIIGIIDVRE